jgi:protein phosphatase PTC6
LARFVQTRFARAVRSLPSISLRPPILRSLRSLAQSRWAGTLANTRGFGDAHYKQLGVFAEPAVSSRILNPASEYAFLILLSDGITDMLSDQEICDLVRGYKDPTRAARNVVSFAESIGA